MNKVLLALTFLVYFGPLTYGQTTIELQDFESTTGASLPTGWTQHSSGTPGWKTGDSTTIYFGLSSTPVPIPAHTRFAVVTDDTLTDNSNDTLISNPLDFTSVTNPGISFDYYFWDALFTYSGGALPIGAGEKVSVLVSTDGGASWNFIDTLIKSGTLDPSMPPFWQTDFFSLHDYGGYSNVRIGIRYSNGGLPRPSSWFSFGVAIDNIRIMSDATTDIALTSIDGGDSTGIIPGEDKIYAQSTAMAYMSCKLFNYSSTSITSFTANSQFSGAPVTTTTISGVNIPPYTFYNFSAQMATPSPGAEDVKVWVSTPGDTVASNDSATKTINSLQYMPHKKLVIESLTGDWCSYCVVSIVDMDSMWRTHPGKVSLIEVHYDVETDPMSDPRYDSCLLPIGSIRASPSIWVDRRQGMTLPYYALSPNAMFPIYDSEHNYFGYADINLSNQKILPGNIFSIDATVIPGIDLIGDYRVALVLTEDSVHNTDPSYNQSNIYSGGALGPMGGFELLPDPVPASQMYYMFVARSINGTIWGDSGSLPSTSYAGSTYTYTLTSRLDSSWNTKKIRPIMFLLRMSDSQIINSNYGVFNADTGNTDTSALVTGVSKTISNAELYPNPASEQVYVTYSLNKSCDVSLWVGDQLGKTIYSVPSQYMGAGKQKTTIPLDNIPPGIYNVEIQAEKSLFVKKLTVVK